MDMPPTCDLLLGIRHVAVALTTDGLRTDVIANALHFTPTQTTHLRLIGIEPLPSPKDANALIRFAYDGSLGAIGTEVIEDGAIYRLIVEDARTTLVPEIDAEWRDGLVQEFAAMGAVANMLSPAVVIEFFAKQTEMYLSASAPIFAQNPDLARNVCRAIRESMCMQIAALLEQDIGGVGTITLENFLAYKAWTREHPAPSSPRSTKARSGASQPLLARRNSRPRDFLRGAWNPNANADWQSGRHGVRPMNNGSVIEIVTDAGADNDSSSKDDDDEEENEKQVEAGDDDDDGNDVVILAPAASALIDGVRHRFVLHSSSGESINTVHLNVAKRQVVLASRGLLTTRKTVIPLSDVQRCDDGIERDALCFSIVTGRRTYHLQTTTARERDIWVAALREFIAAADASTG